MKLHLGCGNDYREGFINCDYSAEVKPDKVIDLEKPLDFEDNSVDFVLANHVFEHITHFSELMHELHRVCKNDARIVVRVPFYASWGQFNDPTHVRFFSPFTFGYFKMNNYSHEVGCTEDMLEVQKVHLNFAVGDAKKLNVILNPIINLNHRWYCRFFAWILPAAEISYVLKIIK
jgi:predicted SAM-dependent methyltransferase